MVAGYVGAAASKSIAVGFIILIVSFLFVSLEIRHPLFMIIFLVLTAVSFSLLGFILGLWARNFEQLNFVPTLVITPLVFLGGSFYSIDMLPSAWQTISMFNPAMYLISGFRWAFFGISEVSVELSVLAVLVFGTIFLGFIWYIFRTGYRLRN